MIEIIFKYVLSIKAHLKALHMESWKTYSIKTCMWLLCIHVHYDTVGNVPSKDSKHVPLKRKQKSEF